MTGWRNIGIRAGSDAGVWVDGSLILGGPTTILPRPQVRFGTHKLDGSEGAPGLVLLENLCYVRSWLRHVSQATSIPTGPRVTTTFFDGPRPVTVREPVDANTSMVVVNFTEDGNRSDHTHHNDSIDTLTLPNGRRTTGQVIRPHADRTSYEGTRVELDEEAPGVSIFIHVDAVGSGTPQRRKTAPAWPATTPPLEVCWDTSTTTFDFSPVNVLEMITTWQGRGRGAETTAPGAVTSDAVTSTVGSLETIDEADESELASSDGKCACRGNNPSAESVAGFIDPSVAMRYDLNFGNMGDLPTGVLQGHYPPGSRWLRDPFGELKKLVDPDDEEVKSTFERKWGKGGAVLDRIGGMGRKIVGGCAEVGSQAHQGLKIATSEGGVAKIGEGLGNTARDMGGKWVSGVKDIWDTNGGAVLDAGGMIVESFAKDIDGSNGVAAQNEAIEEAGALLLGLLGGAAWYKLTKAQKLVLMKELADDVSSGVIRKSLPEGTSGPAPFYSSLDELLQEKRLQFKSTGARPKVLDRWSDHGDFAEEAYEEFRQRTDDVDSIARNTRWSAERIQRIKNHLFVDEHDLGDCRRGRFDADPEIVNAWNRLIDGTFTDNDIRLLRHEWFELRFMGIHKTDYPTAHDATNRSGRPSGIE